MKKKIFQALSLLLLSTACNHNDLQEQISFTDEVQEICATIKDFEFEQFDYSRTSITIAEDGPRYTWAETDTIGIFPDAGRQVEFSMANGVGTTSARFTGGGWGLKSTSTYAAYFPLIGKYYLDKTQIPVDYTGQLQDGNGSTTHLGTYDYLAAPASKVNNGIVSFNFERLGCLVQLKLTISKATTISSVTLTSTTKEFITKGYFDLTELRPAIKSTQKAKSVTIDLKNVKTTEKDEIVTVYFWTAPVDLSDDKIIMKVQSNQVDIPEIVINGKNFEAGNAYALSSTVGVDFVDLGLTSGTLWATTNLGAEKDTDIGNYYAWGEVETKETFLYSNYLYYKDVYESSKQWTYIGSNISGTSYDTAKSLWGEKWAMPTKGQMTELINECTWTKTNKNEVAGYEVKSKVNNNSIFLPVTGMYDSYETSSGPMCRYEGEEYGFYWTSTMYPNGNYYGWSYYLAFANKPQIINSGIRSCGMPIRPVRH